MEQLLAKAAEYLASFPPDEERAYGIFEKAIQLDPKHPEALGSFGELLCNASDGRIRNLSRAVDLLQLSIELQQDGYPERYFYLAQCRAAQPDGALEAERLYRLGISKLELDTAHKQSTGMNNDEVVCNQEKLAMAYCAIAELYLTDLCSTDGAELRVQEAYDSAVRTYPRCFDAHSGLSCYYKTIGNLECAVQSAENAMRIIRDAVDAEKASDDSPGFALPDWNSQLQFASCLVDLEQSEWSKEVLDLLAERDSRNVEIWYIFACHHFALKAYEEAENCILTAKDLLEEVVRSPLFAAGTDTVLQTYVEHWSSVLQKLQQQIELKVNC